MYIVIMSPKLAIYRRLKPHKALSVICRVAVTIRVLVHIRHSAFKSIIYVYLCIYIIVSQSAAEVVAAGRISVRFPSHMTHTIARFIF